MIETKCRKVICKCFTVRPVVHLRQINVDLIYIVNTICSNFLTKQLQEDLHAYSGLNACIYVGYAGPQNHPVVPHLGVFICGHPTGMSEKKEPAGK